MAAALALLNIPNSQISKASAEVVEVLARALRAEPMVMNKPRVLVAVGNEDWRHKVVGVMRDAGADPILTVNGMETIRRLEKAADIDAVFIECGHKFFCLKCCSKFTELNSLPLVNEQQMFLLITLVFHIIYSHRSFDLGYYNWQHYSYCCNCCNCFSFWSSLIQPSIF